MAFDGHQSAFAKALFPTYQRQASLNGGDVKNGGVASPFIVSLQEQDAASNAPWSNSAHDDPFGLISFAQSSVKSRKHTSNTDCDGDSDLQGLVSNILDDADSQDSYFSEGSLPTCNPIWSPKTLREELLQYFQSEAKTQYNHTFPPNYVSPEAVSKAQGQSVDKDVEGFYQQSNGLSANQHWPFNLPNGDRDSHAIHPLKLPPGLPVPNAVNTYLSQAQQSKYDKMPAEKNRRNQPMNHFPDLSDVFRPQSEINTTSCNPYYDDQFTQSSAKPISNEQYGPQDINQLVSSFQLFMAGEHDSLCRGDFPNIHRQTAGTHHEDSMVEQWKITRPEMSTQSSPVMQTHKQLVGEFGPVQKERNGEARKQTFKRDAFQDFPGFGPQNTEYFQPRKPFSASLNLPKQYQSNMSVHRENTSLPINMSVNQYSKHHGQQQGLIQSKLKMQKEKKRMHMSGFVGDGFSTRPLTNTDMRGGDKKQALSQNLYFDHLGSIQAQRFEGENRMVGVENSMQQLLPFMYPVNDPRGYANVHVNASNFSFRPTYGSAVFGGMDTADMIPVNASAAISSHVSSMMACRGESTYHGVTTSVKMNHEGPAAQLRFYLDECYEQLESLERERKMAEITLTPFLGKRAAGVASTNLPRSPPNPTRVDRLIVNQIREQTRVANLLDRMESLSNTPLHINIHTARSRHHMAIRITQARRKEVASTSKQQQHRAHFPEDRDALFLVNGLKELAVTTRNIRKALWCALQMTLPKPVERQEQQESREATQTEQAERASSPFEGYSFKL